MKDIGKLSPVDIRQVWTDEARAFTPWLAENADLQSPVVAELERAAREAMATAPANEALAWPR